MIFLRLDEHVNISKIQFFEKNSSEFSCSQSLPVIDSFGKYWLNSRFFKAIMQNLFKILQLNLANQNNDISIIMLCFSCGQKEKELKGTLKNIKIIFVGNLSFSSARHIIFGTMTRFSGLWWNGILICNCDVVAFLKLLYFKVFVAWNDDFWRFRLCCFDGFIAIRCLQEIVDSKWNFSKIKE